MVAYLEAPLDILPAEVDKANGVYDEGRRSNDFRNASPFVWLAWVVNQAHHDDSPLFRMLASGVVLVSRPIKILHPRKVPYT